MKKFVIIKHVISCIIPYIMVYAFYIEFNGEESPGGGFQSGVIFASAAIAFDLLYKINFDRQLVTDILVVFSALGVVIYLCTGLISIIFGYNYLNYYVLSVNKCDGQHLGIFLVELGVGVTVSSIMVLIYLLLQKTD
ncbi:Na(+)/H(+) antiporter subunit B [Rickettsia endosymbiont of Cardiosporidium cionae]|uniref:Na(+)/H(+) antiporter subunit B n=1 Tax=Rickettsia endosymbiont of Cardiosporidium cionae TaxID=2777155 RepID=UPI00189505C2|nr:Na(+)/H(+) antiporter subunit B [Rickettsia endosymbiont of Cardiosporidium cionae]KAF8818246.1 Na(+)/H(+) antiporter subunit B [Rickettsia endosymbiont of Cardiosporidium cionae]